MPSLSMMSMWIVAVKPELTCHQGYQRYNLPSGNALSYFTKFLLSVPEHFRKRSKAVLFLQSD